MNQLAGFSHVALTVSEMRASRHFYEDLLGMRVLDSNETYCALVTGSQELSALILTTHDEPTQGPFSEYRVGLDHVSLAVSDMASLVSWQARLRNNEVPFRRSP
jgi:catechol 2,3-dioxygenase-like lactoylglutathione lyase family enzyme